MIDIDNQTNTTIDEQMLGGIAEAMTNRDIDLMFVNNEEIREINAEYRDKNEPTDVLSFPMSDDMPNAPLGSIVISVEYAQNEANKLNHSLDSEINILLIHGILHLLGYDHEIDDGEMLAKESEWALYFKLPISLIERSS